MDLPSKSHAGDPSKIAISRRVSPQKADSPASGKRMHFLDALRGIAALAVVVFHFYADASTFAHRWLIDRQNFGAFGVYTFFLVSGFIIPLSLLRHATLWQFWKSRILRLFPPYWFTILLLFLLAAVGLGDRALFHLSPLTYIANFTMTAFLLHQPYFLGVFWTLSVELVFYVLCSGLKLARVLPHRLGIAAGVLLLYLVALLIAQAGRLSPQHLQIEGSLLVTAFIGGVFYQVYTVPSQRKYLLPLLPAYLAEVLLAFYITYRKSPATDLHAAQFALSFSVSVVMSLACFCTFFLLRHRTFPRPLLWLGRVSYSLYLTHIVVGGLVDFVMPHGRYARPTVKLVCSLVAADLCFRFVERPAFAWSHGKPRVASASPLAPISPG
jgi:peptidoglycan/LPS O-acetylase OafA/YrhL